ncbi:MAG: recombinase family protein [Phycisphaerales bacterium]
MIQAIGYIRRSTDKQDESLEQQREKLEQYAERQGWKLIDIYSDDAITGSDMHRAGLNRLLSDAEHRQDFQVVLAWDRNRVARPKDAVDGLMIERRLFQAGKRVVYASTGQEADRSFASGLISYVEHYQNGDYLRKLSRDTVRGIIHRVERGMWPGGPIPFGFDRVILGDDGKPVRIVRDMDDGSQAILHPTSGEIVERLSQGRRYKKQDHEGCTLIPSDPARVRALQRIFQDIAAGKPVRVIRDWLNKSGFRTSRGQTFTPATLHPLLLNPAYVGRSVYNRRTLSKWHRVKDGQSVAREDEGVENRPEADWIIRENAWPALVDLATFERVQQRRAESREQHRKTTGTAIRSEYLLTGLMFCGVCGGRLTGQTMKNQKGICSRYYVCSTHHNGHKDRCPTRYLVPAKSVEQHIIGIMRRDLVKLRDDQQIHDYVTSELQRVQGGTVDATQQLRQRLIALEERATNVREHLVRMNPEVAEGIGLYTDAALIREEQQEIEAELSRLTAQAPELPTYELMQSRASDALDRLEELMEGGSVEEKRAMIGDLIQKIEADPASATVRISLFPAVFSRIIAGIGFEPMTSGL